MKRDARAVNMGQEEVNKTRRCWSAGCLSVVVVRVVVLDDLSSRCCGCGKCGGYVVPSVRVGGDVLIVVCCSGDIVSLRVSLFLRPPVVV